MEWSNFQQDIFTAVESTKDSLIVEAVAGSGKTTTIVEAISHVPQYQSVAFLAFNKAIADELKRRISAPNAKCMTLHSAGYGAWRKFLGDDWKGCEINSRKTSDIVSELFSSTERWRYGATIGKIVAIAKGQGIVPRLKEPTDEDPITKYPGGYIPLIEDTDKTWEDFVAFYGLDDQEWNVELARVVLTHSIMNAEEVIDYDDMLYMPVIRNIPFQKYDVVFLDEAQDVNSLQIEIVSRLLNKGGRVIAVGDPHQSIYGFRGALADSMEKIKQRFGCRTLPLSVSYRCPRNIVAHAREFVSHILPHESAPEGLIEGNKEFPISWRIGEFRSTDAILCRVTRPLIETAFMFIRNKIPCRVLGRDIGQGLVSIVKKQKASSIDDLEERLKMWREREERKANGDEGKLGIIDDKMTTLNVFINELSPTDTVEDLIGNIEALFSDEGNNRGMLTLSTVHKSKGLEFERVFILDAKFHMPCRWARQKWEQAQEINLQYVAATRAKKELRYISTQDLRTSLATTIDEVSA